MRFRGTTIRRKIVALLLIPLVSLTAIWAFAATVTGRAVLDRPDVQRIVDNVGYPTQDAVQSLQQERRAAMIYVANTRDSQARIAYTRQQQVTDASIAKMRTRIAASGVRGSLDGDSRTRLDTFLSTMEGLTSLRQRSDDGRISRNDVYQSYNAMTTPAFDLFDTLNPLGKVKLDNQRRAVVQLTRAREEVSREDALMAAAISTGHMSGAELRSFTFAVAEQRNYYDGNLKTLPDEERAPYDTYWQSSNGKTLHSAEDAVIAAGAGNAPIVAAHLSWPGVAATTMADLGKLNAASSDSFSHRARPVATSSIVEAAFVGGLGLIAVLASLLVSVRIGRGLIRDLTGLRREAQEVSGTRLPRVMRRLAAGEQVDVETEVPRLHYADDEIGQVGRALNTLQRAVVEAAVRQADMRKGVSDVFVNLARRSQVLLHRQLTLLDAMERRVEDSEELADLFRLDHMTTRMRRHAEGLVILSGAAPSRQWRKPVQLMDVVRAAIAEVEDYERIEVRRLPRLAVAGAAVADLTHLLAELIENAAVFSPPHTTVRLHGEPVANGFVLEIDDRGLGLTPDALLEANLRLAETPEFELSDTDRLGLFVVSRLAQRHSVRVSLRQSAYGGTTAVVMVPENLLTDTGDDTGATPVAELRDPYALDPAPGTEHTFRQWGLDAGEGASGEGHKEHAPHPDEPLPILAARPGSGETAPEGTESDAPATERPEPAGPAPLPKRRRRTAPVLVADHGRPVTGPQPADVQPADVQAAGGQPSGARTSGGGIPCAGVPGGQPSGEQPPGEHSSAEPSPAESSGGPRRVPEQQGPRAVTPLPHPREDGTTPAPAVPRQHAGTADTRPAGSVPPPGSSGAAGSGGTVLPRRVRQASLAPQLRTDASRPGGAAAEPDGGGRERSADEVRDRMAAIQRGWQRGRALADAGGDAAGHGGTPDTAARPGPGAGPGPGSGSGAQDPSTSVPRTTSEENGR